MSDALPLLLFIVDSDESRALAANAVPMLADRYRLLVFPSVTAGLKQLEATVASKEPVAAIVTEDPLAGMAGGGLWALQKCRAVAPDCLRLLSMPRNTSVLKLGLEKIRDADPHIVFDISVSANDFVGRLLVPSLAKSDDGVNENVRSATIKAKTPVRVLRIPKETFSDLLIHDARLSIGITRELSRRLRKQQSK